MDSPTWASAPRPTHRRDCLWMVARHNPGSALGAACATEPLRGFYRVSVKTFNLMREVGWWEGAVPTL